MKKLRILLTGGGTGGHIYPLIAVTQELRELTTQNGLLLDARYFGGASAYAQILVDNDIRFVSIVSSKLRRYVTALNLLDLPKFFIGLLQAFWKVFWFMPDAVFSKGGPGALPIVLACKWYMIPIIIQESDSIPGWTNIFSGKLAKKIYIAFGSAANYFANQNKVEVSGNPVRRDLVAQAGNVPGDQAKIAARQKFGLDPNLPLLLVIGGSQGATSINAFILENLAQLVRHFQILHQVGAGNYETYKNEYNFLTKNWSELETRRYQFKAYFDQDFLDAYSAADLVLARAGSGTIFELAVLGKPAVLVPLPDAASDHQRKNAYQYAPNGAALVIEQDNFVSHLVVSQLVQLINDKNLLQQMSVAARNFYKQDAAKTIAAGIFETVVKQ